MNVLRAEGAVGIVDRSEGALQCRPDTDNGAVAVVVRSFVQAHGECSCGWRGSRYAFSPPWPFTTPFSTQLRSAANLRSHWCYEHAVAGSGQQTPHHRGPAMFAHQRIR
jgi:hypothetical protein